MAYIRFGKRIFNYEAELLDANEMPAISHAEAKSVLFATQDILKEIGIDIYLSFGTLLGAVRDKDFIKNDYDIDVYIKDELLLFNNLSKLKDCGMELIRVIKHKIYTFRYKNSSCYIDLYILTSRHNIWGLYCYRICDFYIPKKYLKDGEILFLERKFKCPQSPERLLRFFYYNSWNTPISHQESIKKKIKYIYEVPSHYYFKKFFKEPAIGVIKFFCNRFFGSNKYNKIKGLFYGYGS